MKPASLSSLVRFESPRVRRAPLRAALAAALLAALAAGCAVETTDDAAPQIAADGSEPRIYGGERDEDDAQIDGVVALRVGTGGSFELCTGALVAPNVVLTARHCVTKNTTTSVSCDENGRSANGKHIDSDEDPGTIGIYGGGRPSFGRAPLALGKAIVAPQGDVLCDSDIALVVLDRGIDSLTPLPLRLEAPAKVGETIRAVGYGQNDREMPIGTRFRKSGVRVLAQGKTVSESRTPLGRHEFEVGLSICQGDSGGPAIAEDTGAVIGVVSRGGDCEDDHGHIYTTTAGFDAMFAQAFMLAGSGPTLESTTARPVARTTGSDDGKQEVSPTPAYAGCALAPRGGSAGGAAGLGLGLALALACARRRSARR